MFLNYLKTFLRIFSRNKVFTLINLLGLTAGIVSFVLIRLYVLNETSYDRHYPDGDRMYRMALKGDMSGFSFEAAVMGGPFGGIMRDEIPEVRNSTTFYKLPRTVLMEQGENRFYEENILYVDSAFLSFFNHTLLQGDPENLLKRPNSMVLTRSGARKFFGQADPIGKQIRWNNDADYTITGIIEDPQKNSHLNFDILASYSTLLEQDTYKNLLTTVYAFVTYNYILLDEGAIKDSVETKIEGVVEKYMGEGMREYGSRFAIFLQPVQNIHLHSDLVHELETNGNISSVYIFSAISLLVLLIACINFINLTTARSASRFLEIGIRKISGAGRDLLSRQFIMESVFFAGISCGVSGLILASILPWFYSISGINQAAIGLSPIHFVFLLILLAVIIGILSGIYPALHLTRLRPSLIIKGISGPSGSKTTFRNIMVMVQLMITIFLIFSTLLISKQLNFILNSNTGINKDHLVIVPLRSNKMYNQYRLLTDEMKALAGVSDATLSSSFLGNFQQRRGFLVEGSGNNDTWMLHHVYVDYNYLDMMEVPFLLGRNFRSGSTIDSNSLIINQAMAIQAGWEDPIGKKIIMPVAGAETEFFVIGMVPDFNYASVHNKIESLLMFYKPEDTRYLGLRIQNGNSTGVLESIDKK